MQVGTDSVRNMASLFNGTNQYRIPRYQRRYVWDTTNWDALWRDFLQLQRQIEDGEMDKKHFTGTIITHAKLGTEIGDEVIDGQQRLTTFQIIFCVIRDLCASGVYKISTISQIESSADDFIKLNLIQMEEPDMADNDVEGNFSAYRLVPTTHDMEAFQSVVAGEFGKKIKESTNIMAAFQSLTEGEPSDHNLIVRAYGHFGMKITDYLEEKGPEKLLNLLRTLSNNFHVIKVNLDSTDEPEKIFETINDTGRMLDDFDYLRNHLFLRARNLGEPTIDELYSQYWEKFEEWGAESLDSFLRAFLIAKWGPKRFQSEGKVIKSFDLYRKYSHALTEGSNQHRGYSDALRESMSRNERPLSPVEYELDQLSRYSEFYRELNTSTPVSKNSDLRTFGNRMQFYADLNLPRLDSFMLFLRHRLGFSDSLLYDVCDILESYIVRRMLCSGDEDNYATVNTLFSGAVEAREFCLREFAENLQETLPNSLKEALDQAWLKDVNLILYILYRIELYKREQCFTFYAPLSFKELRSRERIASPGDCDPDATKSVGNITILTSVSPYDWDFYAIKAKKQVLVREFANGLRLSEEIRDAKGWDENPNVEISRRAANLLSDFESIWKSNLVNYIE